MATLNSPREAEIGNDLPNGWARTTVGEIYKVVGGGTPSTKQESYWNGHIPWITSADIHGLEDIQPRRYVTMEGVENSAANIVPENSLIVVTRVSLGKIAITRQPLCYSQDSQGLVARADNVVFPEYALYFLSTAVQSFLHHSRGTTISGVTKKQLRDLSFLLPPLPEQHRIVAEIETQFTRLDAGVAALKRVAGNLRRYKASVLKAACEGRLVPIEAELARVGAGSPRPYEPAGVLLERILAERRAKWEAENPGKRYKEPVAPAAADLPELPEGWRWVTVDQVSTFVQYGTSEKATADPIGVPVLRMGNIKDGQLDFADLKYLPNNTPKLNSLLLEYNDLLFNRTNSAELVGKTAVYRSHHPAPATFASYLIRVKTRDGYLPDLLAVFINSLFGRRYIASVVSQQVGQANVNGTKLRSMPVILPPIADQHRIVAEVERRLSVVKELEAAVEANLKRAERLRQSILKQAFEGRLVPQDPSDEPASAMLERMRSRHDQTIDQGQRSSDRKRVGEQLPLL